MSLPEEIPIISLDISYNNFSDTYILRLNGLYQIEIKESLKLVIEMFYEGKTDEEIFSALYGATGKSLEDIRVFRSIINNNMRRNIAKWIYRFILDGYSDLYILQQLKKNHRIRLDDLDSFYNDTEKMKEHKKNKRFLFHVVEWDKLDKFWKIIHSRTFLGISLVYLVFLIGLTLQNSFLNEIGPAATAISSNYGTSLLLVTIILSIFFYRAIILTVHEFGHGYFYRLFGGRNGHYYIKISGLTRFSGFNITNDVYFIKSRWKKALIAMGGVIFELLAVFTFLNAFHIFTNGNYPIEIIYLAMLNIFFSLFSNLNVLFFTSDGFQLVKHMIRYPTFSKATSDYLSQVITNQQKGLKLNAKEKKAVITYLVSAISFISVLIIFQLLFLQGIIFKVIQDPVKVIPIDIIVNTQDAFMQSLLVFGSILVFLMSIDYVIVLFKQRKYLTRLALLLKLRNLTSPGVFMGDEQLKNNQFIGNYIVLDEKQDLVLDDIPEVFRIILFDEGVKNLSRLDSNRTVVHNSKELENSTSMLTKEVTIEQLVTLINSFQFNYVYGSVFSLIPILEKSLHLFEDKIDVLKNTENIELLKNNMEKKKQLQANTEQKIAPSSPSSKLQGNYIIFSMMDLQLSDIPEYLNIILMGDAVRNTHLDSYRTYTCLHCSEHRGLKPKNPCSYLELTKIIASYDFFIMNGYMFLLGKMMIDAIKILKDMDLDESEWERPRELLNTVS